MPMLPGRKGNLSSGSLSQDISKPQKSISGLFFGKESHAGASRAGGYSVLARPIEWSQHWHGKKNTVVETDLRQET